MPKPPLTTLLCHAELLTILPVVGDLYLALFGAKHSLRHLVDRLLVGEVPMEKVTGAGLLHDVWS